MSPKDVKRTVALSQLSLFCCFVALTIHKSQGIIVGPGQQFPKLIIMLSAGNTRNAPVLELVAFSRAKSIHCLAIAILSSKFSYQNAHENWSNSSLCEIQNELGQRAIQSQPKTVDRITDLDPSPGLKSSNGGCQFLLYWYMELVFGTYNDMD